MPDAIPLLPIVAPWLAIVALVVTAARVRVGVEPLLRRLETLAPVGCARNSAHRQNPLRRLRRSVEAIEHQFATLDERLAQRHRVTGLPTREPLLARIADDGCGLLGAIAFVDFDRLCAFDPARGERALLTIVDRITRMAGRRLITHVDRAHIAIWFGPDIAPDAARAELGAIRYALGDAIRADGEATILPEIRCTEARYPDDGATPQVLLTRALAALALGRGSVDALDCTVAATIDAARDRYLMEQDLRHAVSRGEFTMCYQPLVDAAAGRVCGAEALLRWHHPTRGSVSPARFIPVMEEMGLADEIGLWTLNTACRAARSWETTGLPSLRVAVNVSAHQLGRADMQALVERTLARHSLAPQFLEIELTETVATGDAEGAQRLFDALRKLGVKIAIDDFGTGYSSFSALRTLSFDKIKIDREFVTAVDSRRDSQAICQSIIALGRGLGIRILAEGVERQEEYRWLRRHGCTHFQGYYFSPPLVDDAFVAFVHDTGKLQALLALDPRAAQTDLTERLTA